jgi:tRNA dimethylallyltransferase
MEKLLVICGPTATGKTSLGINLARKFNGEIISSDSRQVYKWLDIGTGKDLPLGVRIKYPWFSKYGYYEIDQVKIWGYDLIDPRREFSVSHYVKFAEGAIKDILKRGKLPIIVGGTGHYIKAVIDGIPTIEIPRNSNLRKDLEKRTATQLYELLAQLDTIRAGEMNSSDKMNPRRLIRAIEVATWRVSNVKKSEKIKKDFDVLWIGLTAGKELLNKNIEKRVNDRIKKGIKEEIENLLKKGVKWNTQAMQSMGYREWKDFFDGKKTATEVAKIWETDEQKYVKRQMTWFKKEKRVNWFDVNSKDYLKKVEKMAEKWHNT